MQRLCGRTACLSAAALFAGATLFVGPAAAEDHTGEIYSATFFPVLDVDQNGVLTPNEVSTLTAAEFAEADANGDGGISRDEMAAWYRGRVPEGTPAPSGG